MSTDSIQPVIPADLTDVRNIRARNRAQQDAVTSTADRLRAAYIATEREAERRAAVIVDRQHSRDQIAAHLMVLYRAGVQDTLDAMEGRKV